MSSSNQNPTTLLFRRLAWQSTIPLQITLADDEPGSGSGCDTYYMQAPRYTYLPLLIPEIKEHLVEVALDDQAFGESDEREWWFEEDVREGEGSFASQGPCKWHWTIDLIHLHSLISHPHSPVASSSSSSSISPTPTQPLRLILHLKNPPVDKFNLPNGVEQCRTQWVNAVKEADFVRWRNTSRSTGMRKGEFDAGWDGILDDDFDSFSRFASRMLPIATPNQPQGSNTTTNNNNSSLPTRPASTDPGSTSGGNGTGTGGGGGAKVESAYGVRALAIKIYLPDNAPVVHELIPPLTSDGKPQTVLSALQTHLPLLFPPRSSTPYPIAFPILQGVELPPEAELAWLSTCGCGADGWLRIGIRLRAGGTSM